MYKANDIVITTAIFRNKVMAIRRVMASGNYEAIKLDTLDNGIAGAKAFRLKDDQIASKIGELNANADLIPLLNHTQSKTISTHEHNYCKHQLRMSTMSQNQYLADRWRLLSTLQVGDALSVNGKPHKLVRIMTQGLRYHFVANNERGTAYKYPIGSIDLPIHKSSPKSTEASQVEMLAGIMG